PNYRVYARDYGRFAERLGRFCRVLLDFDDDGFSPVLGGLDCDDFDPTRGPGVPEQVDGKDRNCNHMIRFTDPAPSQRGLAPSIGDPDAAPGEIDRVVLVTIDCMRHSILSPRVTPNLSRLAERGLLLEKLYAGGARTAISLPLVLRGSYGAPSVASIAAAAGVKTAAIFSYRHSTLQGPLFDGFTSVQRPAKVDTRFRATEVTDRALDVIDATAGPSFLWLHYFDAHGPRTVRVLPADTPHFDPLPSEDEESSLYLAEIAYVDREVGRLVERIETTGGFAKTMMIVTSDHGEGFGLHETWEHGQSAFEEIVHVPGILVGPGIAPGRHEHVVSHRDIASTIAGAFGLVGKNGETEQFGRSWLRLRSAPEAPLHLFVVTYSTSAHVQAFAEAPMVVLTDDHAKFATSYKEGISRLYHLDSPDGERFDLSPDFPDEAAHMQFELEVYRDIDRTP
ncbi:MAG TPA: sulfatase-like hydrolase/transferase, partial [Polyangiaceae bacterium]|nr:sulfatase-like hydrolase/transferase [Polyangiaceae bacterium]